MLEDKAKSTVLLSGITGFLGSCLAIALLKSGYGVVGLKRKSSSLHRLDPILSKITLYDVEDLDFSIPFREHKKINAVIHTATCYGRNDENNLQVFEVNTAFSLRLLNAVISAGVQTFLNTDTALDKYLNSYSLSKKQFAEWGKYLSQKGQITFLNARLEHFYGPGDSDSKFTTYIIKGCLQNIPELKLTLGEQQRDFIFIDDVTTAFLTLLAKEKTFSGFIEFDVGSGKAIMIKDFVEMVRELTKSSTFLNFGAVPYRKNEAMFCQAKPAFLYNLGWKPRYTLEQGILRTIKGIE